jgi:hypothetical protein
MPLLALWDALLRDEDPTTKTKPQDSGYFIRPFDPTFPQTYVRQLSRLRLTLSLMQLRLIRAKYRL